MGHPDEAMQLIKKLVQDTSSNPDVRALAVLFLDLEHSVIKPLRQQVVALERRITAMEAAAVRARSPLSASIE